MPDYSSLKGGGNWEPSVRYLLVLLFLEILAVALLRAVTNHGG